MNLPGTSSWVIKDSMYNAMKNSWTAAWGHTGIFNIIKNPCQHFQPVFESVSMVSNGGNCLDIKPNYTHSTLKLSICLKVDLYCPHT